MNQLIRCINCDEVFFRTPFDLWPEYTVGLPGSPEPFRYVERDDFQDFMEHHHGHRMEDLSIVEDSFVSEKPYIEPIKTSYFRATNGKEKFAIKKFRERIDEPLKYQLIPGDYLLKCLGVEIQGDLIAKQLRAELGKLPFLEEKIGSFLKVYQKIARTLEIQHLERIAEDSPHPLEIYCKLDDVSLMYLLRNCRNIFKGLEYQEIEVFIHRHKEDGVLLLKAKYTIQLSEKARAKEKSVPPAVAIDNVSEKKQEIA
jgi:hypothetical protein